MNTRVSRLHPFGPPDEGGAYFTPLVLPAVYRERHEAGRPFSKEEVLAIAEGGIEAAADRGHLNVRSRSGVKIWISDVPEDEWCFALDYKVIIQCEDSTAVRAVAAAVEKGLEPINAIWLAEEASTGWMCTFPSYEVSAFAVEATTQGSSGVS